MDEKELPKLAAKPAHYDLVVVHGKIAYVSGQVSGAADRVISGHLREGDDIIEAQEAARVSMRRCLGALKEELGSLDNVDQVLSARGVISAWPECTRHPELMDTATQ